MATSSGYQRRRRLRCTTMKFDLKLLLACYLSSVFFFAFFFAQRDRLLISNGPSSVPKKMVANWLNRNLCLVVIKEKIDMDHLRKSILTIAYLVLWIQRDVHHDTAYLLDSLHPSRIDDLKMIVNTALKIRMRNRGQQKQSKTHWTVVKIDKRDAYSPLELSEVQIEWANFVGR